MSGASTPSDELRVLVGAEPRRAALYRRAT